MPKLVIPRGTKPRALMLLAGVSYPGGLPSEMVQPQPGATISVRTALRYAMRCTGATREDVANATLSALRAFYNGDAMRAALAADAWRTDGQQPQVEDEDEEPAPAHQPVTRTPRGFSQDATVPPAQPAPVVTGLDALLGGIVQAQVAAALAARPAIDRDEVARIVRDVAAFTRIEMVYEDRSVQVEGVQHRCMPDLMRLLVQGHREVYLFGPPGSGKSHAAQVAAEAFQLPFAMTGKVESKYDLFGFTDAHGRPFKTAFRRCWEEGGVFLFDEMDRSDPSAVVALNGALANGYADFPDGPMKRHARCFIIGGGNTTMGGADRAFNTAQQQDQSVIDRFTFLQWSYDEAMERILSGEDQSDWVAFVQRVRRAADKLRVSLLATPRASMRGAKMLRDGWPREQVEAMALFKGLDEATVAKLREEAR